MTRGTVLRLLQREVACPQSQTFKRRVFDDWSRGWRLEWTNSPYADVVVRWENGSLSHLRSTPAEERDRLRAECLDDVERVLTAHGYDIVRESACIRILRRNQEV